MRQELVPPPINQGLTDPVLVDKVAHAQGKEIEWGCLSYKP
jgi:hypothetical protein